MPARILVIRTSAIGDVVFASPFAAALRRTYPQAHVAWLVQPSIGRLLEADPNIDEIVPWPQGEWRRLWRGRHWLQLARSVRTFSRELRARRFDLAIDLQGLLKSGIATWMTRARERVGLGSREGSAALMTRVIPKGGDIDRISSEYLFAAQQLGLDTDDFLPRLHVGDAADAGARRVLAEHGLTPGRYALLAPFTTRPQKHWFEDAWRRLVPLLRERFDLTSIVAGGPADMEAAARIGSGLPDVVSLAGATSLTETAALVRHAALVVGVDTGVTHMATALETPVVVLFGSTRPYLQTGRPSGQVIWLGLPCSPCHRHPTCGGAYSCLRDITPELVAERAALALESRGTA